MVDPKQNTKLPQGGAQLGLRVGRSLWLFQGIYALILAMSPLLCLFSAIPLSENYIIFGRNKGVLTAGLLLLLIIGLSFTFSYFKPLIFLFLISLVMVFFYAETILGHGQSGQVKSSIAKLPIRAGLMTVAITFLLGGAFLQFSTKLSPKEYVLSEIEKSKSYYDEQRDLFLNQSGDQAFALADLFNSPERLWNEIRHIPSYFYMTIMIVFWLNFYVLLRRLNRLETLVGWAPRSPRAHHMMNYRVPDQMIWVLLAVLSVLAYGYYFTEGNSSQESIFWGINLLRFVGVFYFFQGFGVFIYFLYFLKIRGIIHFLLALITIITLPQIIALVGATDFWFDFRKKMIRKKLSERD